VSDSERGANRALRATALLATAYIAAQMLADISSLKITEVAGMSMDAGTLVYPFTFTLRDLVHRVAGVHVARALIVAAAVVNLAMAGLFWLVDKMPAVSGVGPQTDQFGAVLAPVWRIVFASILAEIVSELIAFIGVVPGSDVWEIVTTNILVKGAITLISIPWIYWVRRGKEDDSQSPDR